MTPREKRSACGDTIRIGNRVVKCSREKGHALVGFNDGRPGKYDLHRGDGWHWDERCVRVEVSQGGPHRLRIAIWGRERKGGIFERHPTIEQAIERFREGDEGRREEWDAIAARTGGQS